MPEYKALKQQYDEWLAASEGWMKKDLESIGQLPPKAFREALQERFSVDADFGTGGLRSVIRAGTNGINDFWIQRICKALRVHSRKVVIAYDTRRCSEGFALTAARTLSAAPCEVFLFDEPMPTPVLSFAVKHMQCDTGIVITASHNPKTYNGFKLYDENGVQYTPDKIERLNQLIKWFSFLEKDAHEVDHQRIKLINESVVQAYYSQVFHELDGLYTAEKAETSVTSVIYTPLHGTGAKILPTIMKAYGIDVQVVEAQMSPDTEFATVRVPNPEDPASFEMALKQAKNMPVKPMALIATDPDADRLGVFVEHQGTYQPISGNEMGILFLDYILRKKGISDFKGRQAVLKTIVTTDAVKPMADQYNLKVVETLTGFKYLGQQALALQSKGIHTLFSFEESYGYLYGSHAGDKDACSTAGLLALLLLEKGPERSLFERLEAIRHRYGFYMERLLTHQAEGLDGLKKLTIFMNRLRANDLLVHWGEEVAIKDYLHESGLLKANVVAHIFQNGDRIIFRPSGTEPKIKAYINVNAQDQGAGKRRLDDLEKRVYQLFESNLD